MPSHEDEVRAVYYPETERLVRSATGACEVLLIKGYDSSRDARARVTLHTAFGRPCTPASSAPARESIGVRVLAFFDPPVPVSH